MRAGQGQQDGFEEPYMGCLCWNLIYCTVHESIALRVFLQSATKQVLYADVLQPVVIALERYLDYPPVGAQSAF